MHLAVIGSFGFTDPDPAATLAAWAELAGVASVQAYRNPVNPPSVAQMLAMADAAKLPFDSLHGWFGPDFDPSAPDESLRRRSVDAYRQEGRFVRQLGGDMVVVHPSPGMDGYDGADRGQRVEQLKRSISELSEIGQSLGVTFLMENQPPYHPVGADTAELVSLVMASRHQSIGICFDAGHAHLVGDEVAALQSVGPLLKYIHASDNDSTKDQHELCFTGTVNWAGVGAALREMRYPGPFMFEVFFDAPQIRSRLTADWVGRLTRALGPFNNGRTHS